jgi:hypothetical protein
LYDAIFFDVNRETISQMREQKLPQKQKKNSLAGRTVCADLPESTWASAESGELSTANLLPSPSSIPPPPDSRIGDVGMWASAAAEDWGNGI